VTAVPEICAPSDCAARRPRAPAGFAAALGSGSLALAACALVALAAPSVPGRYGLCPFNATTGLWCPLCGSLRAVHHLARGDVAAAAGANLLLVLAAPLAAYAWLAWAGRALGRPRLPVPRLPAGVWWALLATALVVLGAFGILRNLAPFAWLAPQALSTAR